MRALISAATCLLLGIGCKDEPQRSFAPPPSVTPTLSAAPTPAEKPERTAADAGATPTSAPGSEIGGTTNPWLQRTLHSVNWPRVFEGFELEVQRDEVVITARGRDKKARVDFYNLLTSTTAARIIPEQPDLDAEMHLTAVSPDGKLKVSSSEGRDLVTLTLTNLESKTSTNILELPYTGDWSIGHVAWSPSGASFYFDNGGAVACIWQYDLESGRLTKVVPEHFAAAPHPFRWKGEEWLAYIESEYDKPSYIRLARPLSKSERRQLAKGARAIDLHLAKWTQVVPRGEEWVVETPCSGEPATLSIISGESPRVEVSKGRSAAVFPIHAVLRKDTRSFTLVERRIDGSYLQTFEIEYLDAPRRFAEIRQMTSELGTFERYVSDRHREKLRTVSARHCAD